MSGAVRGRSLLNYFNAMETEETVHYYVTQRYCEQVINISYFYDLLESMGNRRWLITCRFIFRAYDGAPIYHPMLILACLTGVSGLVVNTGQWSDPYSSTKPV